MSRLPECPAQPSAVGRTAPGTGSLPRREDEERAPVSGGLLRVAAKKMTWLMWRDGERPAYADICLTESDPQDSLYSKSISATANND